MRSYVPKIIGAGELQRKTADVLKKIAQEEEECFVVTHNVPQIVMMNIGRYSQLKALEELELNPHRKTSLSQVRQSFEKKGLYSKAFLDDLEDGLKKSSVYSKK